MLWGERTAPIFIMLQDALKRGVKVTILLDNYTRMRHLYGMHGKKGAERLQQTFRTLEDLSALGAKVCSFGKIGFPPQKGRCHVKITVIDNKSYSFGGINFSDESFDFTDYMLASSSVQVADCLEQLVDHICRARPPLSNGEVKIDKDHSVLFDGGRLKHSIIYERACELTAQARRVYFASQMVPSGQLARLLHETEAKIFTNRPEQMDPIASLAQAFDQQKYRTHNSYTGEAYIHAKVILFELPGDKKVLLAGSNNFSYRGVAFGTQEIAMHATDADLWDRLYTFIDKRIIKSRYKKNR
jgi:phosphatidylserine/phosphatidylglycerophosphate/cardiolipin synthase-like enzyme